MADLPLILTLEPIIPERTPREADKRRFTYGFNLRIPNGPLVNSEDPLLAALGAELTRVVATGQHGEALQTLSAEPGSRLMPVIEPPDEDGDPVIGVWDRDQTRCVGLLPWKEAGRVAAALEQGIEVELLALREQRTAAEDWRVVLEVLISIPGTLRVSVADGLSVRRPTRKTRRRLVLFADESGDVRWWDPAAENGPADVGELPVSGELQQQMERLGRAYSKFGRKGDEGDDSLELVEIEKRRVGLVQEAVRLWCRARQELGRDYAVGFLGPGMESPAWSPSQLTGGPSADEDIPF